MIRRAGLLALVGLAGCGPAPVLQDYSYARGYRGEARLRAEVEYAAGKLQVGPSTSGGLFEMDLRYDASRFRPIGDYAADGTVRLGTALARRGGFRIGRRNALPQNADIGFAPQAALDLKLQIGAAESELELGELRLQALRLTTGAGRTMVRFGSPNPESCGAVEVETGAGELVIQQAGNSGCSDWRLNGGVGKVTVDLAGAWRGDPRFALKLAVGGVQFLAPRGMGVRIRMEGAVSQFAGEGFTRAGKTWTSAGFDQATRKAEVEVKSAVGEVRVVWK